MCKIECWTTSKCVQLAKSCPWAAKTDLTCYIKLDLNVGRQALALRSASGPKNQMQRQNKKCGIKIQMLWSMDIVFLPETSQTTAHHCVFKDLKRFKLETNWKLVPAWLIWVKCQHNSRRRFALSSRPSERLRAASWSGIKWPDRVSAMGLSIITDKKMLPRQSKPWTGWDYKIKL